MPNKLKVEYVSIDDIKTYPNNAKLHPAEQIEQIKKSIQEFGFNDPIAIDEKGVIIEGHGRYIACNELGITEVPIIRLNELTDEQKRAYMLVHNKLTMNSDFDLEILMDELDNISFDMSDYGFDMEIEEPEQEIEEVETPEPPKEPKSKLGDIYQLGNHRLMCGDSTSIDDVNKLMNGEKADMVFTDPPYGMNLDTDYSVMKSKLNTFGKNQHQGGTYKKVIGDNEDFKDELVTTIFDNFDYCKEIFVWGADYYPHLLKDYSKGNYIVWDKRTDDNLDKGFGSCFELCWTKNKHKKDIARVKWFGLFGTEKEFDKKRVHPTQKPTELSRWFIDKYSNKNNLIVDLYGGSGSTLIACEQLNRKCYCMELDPQYIDVIIQRWENFTGQKAVKIC